MVRVHPDREGLRMSRSEEAAAAIESLKSMLVARATNDSSDEIEYGILRKRVVADPSLKSLLPKFVVTSRTLYDFWGFIQPKFDTYKERRRFLQDEFEPILSFLESRATTPSDESAATVIAKVDSDHIREAWQKAMDRKSIDSEGAITAARTLLETVCKHVLDTAHVEYADDADLPRLYRKASEVLNLAPSQHTAEVFKQILGSCASIVEGLGALRNRLSDAHGKGQRNVRPSPRHAELAVNLAGAVAVFIIETQESRRRTPAT